MSLRIALVLAPLLWACERPDKEPLTGTATADRSALRRSSTILLSALDPTDAESGVSDRGLDTTVTGAFFVGDTLYMDAFALRDALAPQATIVQRGGVLYVNDSLFGPAKAMLRGHTIVNAKQFARLFGAYVMTDPQYSHATIHPRDVLLFLSRNREHQERVGVLVGARAEGLLPPLPAPRRD